jgi:hypothetical protein
MNITEILLTFCIRSSYITSKAYGRHHDLVNRHKWPQLCSVSRNHRVCNNGNTMCSNPFGVHLRFLVGFVLVNL